MVRVKDYLVPGDGYSGCPLDVKGCFEEDLTCLRCWDELRDFFGKDVEEITRLALKGDD